MAKTRVLYTCQQCGNESAKWFGRCPECGAWNSYVEGVRGSAALAGAAPDPRSRPGAARPERLADVSVAELERVSSGLQEFDRVLGDGIVPGSLVLVGGDPGIGKSTIMLQVATNVAAAGRRVLYVSGEESARQVRLRSERLGTVSGDLYVLAETSLDAVLAQVEALEPDLLIVDSIQTVYIEGLAASPGNVSQLRECALRLMGVAKTRHLPVFLVGHVTKEGNIAGPRSLEHIVDCVLYLEGERFYAYRLLRAEKNRFGSTNEIGVFEMEADGLRQVLNPSAAFLSERQTASAGSAVTVPLEGSRAILVEVQSLVTGSGLAMPRRTAIGVDLNRLHLLLAVLGKRVGMPLGSQDVYVNVVAGIKIAEPAADLGLALAIASSWRDTPVDPGLVVVGEVGLLGELRPVRQLERRLAEAGRLGFERCIVPSGDLRRLIGPAEGSGGRRASNASGASGEVRRDGLLVQGAATVGEALTLALGAALDVRGGGRSTRDGGRGRSRPVDGAEAAGIDRFRDGRSRTVDEDEHATLEPVE
ncbi:MAG: DNA repair protein RadA [Chloroflexota bacterium]|nr:DNA repair protein RadA [Chloroflexota bacterium]